MTSEDVLLVEFQCNTYIGHFFALGITCISQLLDHFDNILLLWVFHLGDIYCLAILLFSEKLVTIPCLIVGSSIDLLSLLHVMRHTFACLHTFKLRDSSENMEEERSHCRGSINLLSC